MTNHTIELMKDWIKDCVENEEDVDDSSDEQIIRWVERNFDGGVAEFLATIDPR